MVAGMEISPFPYHGPLAPSEVRGRDGLLQDLTARVTERRPTALLGPRRFGKTSVLRRLAADLTEVTTVWVDLYAAATHADLAVRFASALSAAGQELGGVMESRALSAGVNLGMVKIELARPARDRPDPTALFERLVEVTVETALRTPVLLVLDEFQAVARIDRAAAVLRTALQQHYRDIGLVFAGSEPSLMRDLFGRNDEPFFGQADIVEIHPLDHAAVREIIDAGFRATDRDPGAVADTIHAFTRGHPQRTMMSADVVWRRTPPGERADDERWAEAVVDLRRMVQATLASRFVDLPMDRQKVLRVLAHGGALFGAAGERMELSNGGGAGARDALLADGTVSDVDGRLRLTDPLFADWILQTFPG